MDSAVLGQFSSSCYYAAAPSSTKEFRGAFKSVTAGRRVPAIRVLSPGFSDQGHLQYYNSRNHRSASAAAAGMMTVMSEKEDKAASKDKAPKKMKKKQQLKLLKELSRDLSTFSQIGFGFESDGALVDQVQRDMMTEAADIILERLQKLRTEEKELKKKMKEEKSRLKTHMDCEMSSSGSSSESSDDECQQIVNIKNVNNQAQMVQSNSPQVLATPTIDSIQSKVAEPMSPGLLSSHDVNAENQINKKIEVCMGGKCKKSGGEALLEEFKKAVGIDGAVSGCKCMGKCKEGPNVKVLNGADNNNVGNQQPSNSLCIGVGLEDVGMIVAKFMVQNHNNNLGFAAASY